MTLVLGKLKRLNSYFYCPDRTTSVDYMSTNKAVLSRAPAASLQRELAAVDRF